MKQIQQTYSEQEFMEHFSSNPSIAKHMRYIVGQGIWAIVFFINGYELRHICNPSRYPMGERCVAHTPPDNMSVMLNMLNSGIKTDL